MLTPFTATQTLQLARAALKSGRGAGLPELLKLIETLSSNIGETNISEIADLIEKDPAVLCRLLSVANTIIHNPHVAPMASIPHAIHQLGFQRVRSLAVSLMLVENTGGVGNPPEQREATAKALCAGLLAHGTARSLGVVDPEMAFACAALRQFGHIILPVVSLELYREVPELMKEKPLAEDEAYTELFGLTPLELSRKLLGGSKLPGEVIESLNECHPELMSNTLASTYSAKALGVADFSCRLAGLALNGAHNAAKFDALSQVLANEFELLLPGVGSTLDAILLHTDERIGSYTRGEGTSSLATPSLKRITARSLHKNPSAIKIVPPAKKTAPITPRRGTPSVATPETPTTGAKPAIPAAPVVASPTAGSTTPPAPALAPAEEKWTEQLAQTKAFETQTTVPTAAEDRWTATLTFVRDSFAAQDCWLLVAPPGGGNYAIVQGIGKCWQEFKASASARADERTVFGICLSRRENVVIHDTGEPTLAPYLPPWFRQSKGAPGAFILMPLHSEGHTQGLVLIGWSLPQRITVTAAQTELARQLFANANIHSRNTVPAFAV